MEAIQVSASYVGCRNNFVITGIKEGNCSYSELQRSFTAVIMNILQRSNPAYPSRYIEERLGPVPDCRSFCFLRNDGYIPQWHNTIKGTDNGFNPAEKFYYELWPVYLEKYDWIRQLIIPEAAVDKILNDYSGKWHEQCVDFYLPLSGEYKGLVIEVDGTQHRDIAQKEKDEKRDAALTDKKIKILRINVSDIISKNAVFDSFIQEVKRVIDYTAKEISCYLNAERSPEYAAVLQYEDVIRAELLLLHLIDNRIISLADDKWHFKVDKSHWEAFMFAAEDLFKWYENLYGVKGITFTAPAVSLDNSGLTIRMLPFARPDETIYDGITVMTDAWDGYDYFKVKCAELINYEIAWPMQEENPRVYYLKELLSDIICEKSADGVTRFDDFRTGQLPIIVNILNLRRTIGILPTGGGKSLCYQLCCMLQPAASFVVCPIMALQKDQKDNLDRLGITRTEFISGLKENSAENSRISEEFGKGKYLIVWISPERFQTEAFRNNLMIANKTDNFAYAVIDEVHCLSEWGHDFRTSYLTLIPTIEKYCPQAKLVGLTATASSAVLKDLKCEFSIGIEDVRATQSLKRENLKMSVINLAADQDKLSALHETLNNEYGNGDYNRQGIVFTVVRDKTDDFDAKSKSLKLLEKFRKWYPQIPSAKFHGRLDTKIKLDVQEQFMTGNVKILSATKAFGMGLNKKDVRYTVHYGLPWSVEAFYQEAGRAGRDNKDSNCYIIYNPIPENIAKSIGEDRLFAPTTTVKEISEIQELPEVEYTDLGSIFYLWLQNNKGVDEDISNLKLVLNEFKNLPKKDDMDGRIYYQLSAPNKKKPDKILFSDAELALYRLKILGVVEDWTVEFHPKGSNILKVYLFAEYPNDYVKDKLFNYIRRIVTEFPRADNSEDAEYLAIMNDASKRYVIRYAEVLIRWTYANIIYSRRQAIYHIKQFCEDFTTQEEFRTRIDNFLAINESSIRIDYIVSGDADWHEWFELLYKPVAEPESHREYLSAEEFTQLRDIAARYLESYNRCTGLNLVYVLAGALSENFNTIVDQEIFQIALDDIYSNPKTSESGEIILQNILDVLSAHKNSIDDEVMSSFAKVIIEKFPDMAWKINELYGDSFSTLRLLSDMTKEIIGGAKCLTKY
jgi:ATP-dependent DNA helicase RecQ